jgi:diguanylate cyclase (GGDEF)-like protein
MLCISIPFILYIFFEFLGIAFGLLFPTLTSIFIGGLFFYRFYSIHQLIEKLLHDNKEIEKYNEIKDVMLQISNSIVYIKNMDALLQLFVNSAVQILDKADTASILIKNEEDLFEFKAAVGFDLEELSKIKLPMDETFLSESNYKKSVIIHNPALFDFSYTKKTNFQSFQNAKTLDITSTISTPILLDGELYGLINVDSIKNHDSFNKEDVMVMEYLTGQLSVAIKNVLLFEKTLFLSRYDGLTKVYHRHYFDELFNNLYERSKRYNETFCLCIVDLNNLKKINDVYGHLAGDLAIKHFANTLRNNIRTSDILGRFGGDEFVLLFINATYEQVENKMKSISSMICENPLNYDQHNFHVQFSYGISSFPKDTKDRKELLKIADTRMYKNKAMNKNM